MCHAFMPSHGRHTATAMSVLTRVPPMNDPGLTCIYKNVAGRENTAKNI